MYCIIIRCNYSFVQLHKNVQKTRRHRQSPRYSKFQRTKKLRNGGFDLIADHVRQRGLIYTEHKPLGRLYKMCCPFFHEFRVIPSANGFQLVCYTVKKCVILQVNDAAVIFMYLQEKQIFGSKVQLCFTHITEQTGGGNEAKDVCHVAYVRVIIAGHRH